MLYKVTKEEGVVVDDVLFAKGEVLEFDPENLEVSDFLADGSLVETSVEVETEVEPELAEEVADEQLAPKEDTHRLGEEA